MTSLDDLLEIGAGIDSNAPTKDDGDLFQEFVGCGSHRLHD